MAQGADRPAEDLAEVWSLLDELPRVRPQVDHAATTIEMVAARAGGSPGRFPRPAPSPGQRAAPLAAIAIALAVGILAGRLAAPDPDRRILEQLPLIEHLGLLQEAGSVEFLDGLAARIADGQGVPSRWPRLPRDPAALEAEAADFDAELAALATDFERTAPRRDRLVSRRERLAELPEGELSALEKSAAMFAALSAIDRRELVRLAGALADPDRGSLRDAARQWHAIVAAVNPAFRRNVIEMPAAERLEWLARSAGRYESWSPGRGPPSRGSGGPTGGGPGGLPPRRPPFRSPWPPLSGLATPAQRGYSTDSS
jgi:hypothetical protein